MGMLAFGPKVLTVDEERTRAYYASHPLPENAGQARRNWAKYCAECLTGPQRALFDALGALPERGLLHDEPNCALESFELFECGQTALGKKGMAIFCSVGVPVVGEFVKGATEGLPFLEYNEGRDLPWLSVDGMLVKRCDPCERGAADFPEGFPAPALMLKAFAFVPWLLPEPCALISWEARQRENAAIEHREIVEQFQFMLGTAAQRPLEAGALEALIPKLLDAFVPRENRVRAGEVCLGEGCYLWHMWSYGLAPCLEGAPALRAYAEQRASRYFAFVKHPDLAAFVEDGKLPSLGAILRFRDLDLLIVPETLDWVFSRTHESYYGPYFARALS